MSLGATLSGSLLAVLARPSTWALSLLGFLVRGGWLFVVAPIVVVPTPVGLANVVAPLVEDVAFGRRTGDLAVLAGAALIGVLVWVIGGGLVGAVTEAECIRSIADEEAIPWRPGPAAWRILFARLIAHVPLAIGLVWAAVRIVGVGYRELTVPSDVATPVAWRIVIGAPDAFAIVLVAWLFGEVVGAMAARRIIIAGDGGRPALAHAARRLRHQPGRVSALGLATTMALVIVLALSGLAAAATWNALGSALSIGDTSIATTLLLVGFVALFLGGLVLVGLACAWRGAVWTLDIGGTFGGVGGTFGGVGGTRSGD